MFMLRCIFWDEDMLQHLKMVLLLPLNYVQLVSRLKSHVRDNLPKKMQKKTMMTTQLLLSPII